MNRNDCYFLIFLMLFLIVASMIIVYLKMKTDRYIEEETEVVTSDTDPYLKMIADMRESIINQILAAIKITWQPDEKDFIIQQASGDNNSNLIVVYYKDIVFRIYCNWRKKKIKIGFSFYPISQPYKRVSMSCKLRIKDSLIDLEKLDNIMIKWYFAYFKLLYNNDEDEELNANIVSAMQIANNANVSDNELLKMLFEVWDEFNIRKKNKEYFIDTKNFVRLTAFLFRHHKDNFIKFLEEHQEEKDD
ncbi:MAG: hypothetical protein MR841_09355 [Lactobacillus johnsonii]|nr:hypothetical protein [Lactobacillus johnsonii]